EHVALDVPRLRAELGEQVPGVGRVRDQPPALDVGVLLADEPRLGVPTPALPLAGQPLDVARAADVLGAEGDELVLRPHLNAVALAPALRAGLLPPAALRLGPGVFGVRHPLPRGLGLLDVPPGRLALLLGCHDPPPVRVTFPWGT